MKVKEVGKILKSGIDYKKMYIARRCWKLTTLRTFLRDNKSRFSNDNDLKHTFASYKQRTKVYGDVQDSTAMMKALGFIVKTDKGWEVTDPEIPIEELQKIALKRIKGLEYYVKLYNEGYGGFSKKNGKGFRLMYKKMTELSGNNNKVSWDRPDLAGTWYAPAYFNTAKELELIVIERPVEKLANYDEEPSIPSSIRVGQGTFGFSSGTVRTSFGTNGAKSENIVRNYMDLDKLSQAKWKDRQAIVDIVSQIISIDGKEYMPMVKYVPVDYFWEGYVKKVRKKQNRGEY